MGNKKVYFVSDVHLGASYIRDPRAHERRFVSWLKRVGPTAGAIYLLGDVLDYWFEYREVVPRGYVRLFGALAELSDAGVEITWLKGNHDIWIFDYLPGELGIRVVDGALEEDILGRRFFLEHGDGVGRKSLGFRLIRSVFRNRVAQKLFSGIHPRWTVPFAHRWSSSSRAGGKAEGEGSLVGPLLDFSARYASAHPSVDYFVYGHLHEALERDVPGSKAKMFVLGDWIERFTYGVFDGHEFRLLSDE